MADRLRIVTRNWPKPVAVVADLSAIGTSRDSFAIKVGDANAALAAGTTRFAGERIVGERRSNAALTMTLLATGTSKDAALAKVSGALNAALASNRTNLAIEWRPDGATYSEFWPVRGPATYGISYSWAKFASANLMPVDVTFPVAPVAEGAPYDILDDFSVDTITAGDWIKDAGTNTLSVAGGYLVPSGSGGTASRYRHGRGYLYGDVEVALTINPGSTSGTFRLCLGMDPAGAETYLALELTSAGAALVKVVAGSRTSLSTSGTILMNQGGIPYYLLLRRAGNVLYWRVGTSVNWAEYTTEPNTYQLAGADLRFAAPGHVGFSIIPGSTNDLYGPFSARPYVYRGIATPEEVQLVGAIVGDVSAEADIEVTPVVGGSTAPAIFGLVGWGARPKVCNLCDVGNFTTVRTSGSATYGWGTGAVSGVIGAASSYSRATPSIAKYGASILQISCPATTDTGANFLVTRRFKRGRVYGLLVWLGNTSGSTSARVKLGVSGDLSTGAAAVTNLGPTKVFSTVWQPTADRDAAYIAIGINAATLTSLEADGIVLVESPTITLSAAIGSLTATTFTPYYTPTDLPDLNPDGSVAFPFLVMIDQELMRVKSIVGGVWTVDRQVEGSVATTHAQDAFVVVLPPSRPQYEGKGAQAAFGILEGEMHAADRTLLTLTANTSYRAGGYGSISASGSIDYYVDPSAIMPDDFADGDALVEFWARLAFDPAATNMSLVLSANSSEQYDPGTALSAIAGQTRYTFEYGSAGMAIARPTGSNGVFVPQFFKLGVLPMVCDRKRPQRWRVRLAYTGTGGIGMAVDYLMAVPLLNRAATPTGRSSSDTTYPTFVPNVVSANAVTKILRADGSGLIRVPRLAAYTAPDAFPDGGSGHTIDLPNTDTDLLVKLSNLVPNDPAAGTEMFSAEPFWTTQLHVAVTPRFAAARSA